MMVLNFIKSMYYYCYLLEYQRVDIKQYEYFKCNLTDMS